MRFKNHGVAPKSAADFAFLLHGLPYLKDDGVMAINRFLGGLDEVALQCVSEVLPDRTGASVNVTYRTGLSASASPPVVQRTTPRRSRSNSPLPA